MDQLLDASLRALISLVLLFFVTKLIGKKQVSQLSVFDYVIGISIGNFAAEITVNLDVDMIIGIVAVLIFGFIAYFISFITMKSIKLRRFFIGKPTIVIENGVLLEKELKNIRYDINDLLEQCRELGYFDISLISYAIMETSGRISILPKKGKQNVLTEDLKIKTHSDNLYYNLIIDGNIMTNSLKSINKDTGWLYKKLKGKKVLLKDVLLATCDNKENLQFYLKNNKEASDVLE